MGWGTEHLLTKAQTTARVKGHADQSNFGISCFEPGGLNLRRRQQPRWWLAF